MNNTKQRVFTGLAIVAILGIAALLEYFKLPAVRWLSVIVALSMLVEMGLAIKRAGRDLLVKNNNAVIFCAFFAWLIVFLCAAYSVGSRPWLMLLLLLIICAADIGAWGFGKLLGGDKMWERISPSKTWSGQIAGVVCGTCAALLYGIIGSDAFLPQLLWIGISVSLLSQYGDLTASWIKRRLKLKDFGNAIPGHGGFLDRFDGWLYVLPLIWFIVM